MQKKTIYITAIASALIAGVFLQIVTDDSLFSLWDIPIVVFSLFLVFAWYCADTNQRGIKRNIWGNCALVCVSVIALPYYLIKSRGWKKGLLGSLVFFLINIAWSLLESLGAEIAFQISALLAV